MVLDWVDGPAHEKALAALLAADRRRLGVVDCVSFEAIRRRGIHRAFAFDSHFSAQGFPLP